MPKRKAWERPEDVFQGSKIVWDQQKRRFIVTQAELDAEEDIAEISSQSSNDNRKSPYSSPIRLSIYNDASPRNIVDCEVTSLLTDHLIENTLSSVSIPDVLSVSSSSSKRQGDATWGKEENVNITGSSCQDECNTSPNISEVKSTYGDVCESSISNSDYKRTSENCEDSDESHFHVVDRIIASSLWDHEKDITMISSELNLSEQRGSSPNISEMMSTCTEQRPESISSCNSEHVVTTSGIRGSEWLQTIRKETLSAPKLSRCEIPEKRVGNRTAVDMIKKLKKVKGGFLQQLEDVLIKSSETIKTLGMNTCSTVKVRLQNFRPCCSNLVADCTLISEKAEEIFSDLPSPCKLGIVLPNQTVQKWCIHQDVILHLIPPWQTLYVSNFEQWFLLCPTVTDVES